MKTTGVYQNYKLIIEKIFNPYNDFVLKSIVFEKFNNYLLSEGFEKKSLKTLDRIIETMIHEDYEFLFGFHGHERTLKLNFIPNKFYSSNVSICNKSLSLNCTIVIFLNGRKS
jgi:hypothetical protein